MIVYCGKLDIAKRVIKMADNQNISTIIREKLDFFDELEKAVVLIDNDFNISAFNTLFANFVQYDKTVIGQSFLPFICPDDWASCSDQLDKLLRREQEIIKTEKRFKNNAGQYMWASVVAKRWQINESETYIFLLFEDISMLKTTQKMLSESEIKYSGLIENLPVAVFHVDLEEQEPKVYFSKQFENLFHINPNEFDQNFIGLRKYIHPNDLTIFSHSHSDLQETKNLIVTEYRLVNDSKETFWVREQAFLIRSDKNRITHIYGVMTDITTEKKTRQQLLQTELNHQTLIESANDRIGVLDLEGNLTYGNSHFFDSLGMDKKEYLSQPNLEHFHPKDQEKHLSAVKKVLETGNATYEYRVKHKNGQYLYMHNKLTLLKDENGLPDGILSINRDITKLKKIEKELIDARKKAEESDRLKSAFLANMSHEIRTPLNGIIGFSKLLSNPEIIDKKRKMYSDIIERNSQQLLSLISDIIDLAKIESDQLKIFSDQMNLNDLLEEINQIFINELIAHSNNEVNLILTMDLEREKSFIIADRFRLAQLFNNLLSNAVKFTQTGQIEFGYRYSGKDLLFFVKDTGIGISPEFHDVIFEPFRQEDDTMTRKYGGTGLGLAICKRLVHLMGGKLWLESDKGKGSIFYFNLNLSLSDKPKPEANQVINEKVGWKGKTILIVDDNKDVLAYLNEIMVDCEAKIITAESGEDAIEICNWAEKIDLILMDIQMPVMDGYTATKEIMKIYPNIPIIAQTAHAMAGDDKKCIKAGCVGYISKPIDKIKLKQLISMFLDKKENNTERIK